MNKIILLKKSDIIFCGERFYNIDEFDGCESWDINTTMNLSYYFNNDKLKNIHFFYLMYYNQNNYRKILDKYSFSFKEIWENEFKKEDIDDLHYNRFLLSSIKKIMAKNEFNLEKEDFYLILDEIMKEEYYVNNSQEKGIVYLDTLRYYFYDLVDILTNNQNIVYLDKELIIKLINSGYANLLVKFSNFSALINKFDLEDFFINFLKKHHHNLSLDFFDNLLSSQENVNNLNPEIIKFMLKNDKIQLNDKTFDYFIFYLDIEIIKKMLKSKKIYMFYINRLLRNLNDKVNDSVRMKQVIDFNLFCLRKYPRNSDVLDFFNDEIKNCNILKRYSLNEQEEIKHILTSSKSHIFLKELCNNMNLTKEYIDALIKNKNACSHLAKTYIPNMNIEHFEKILKLNISNSTNKNVLNNLYYQLLSENS